MCISIVLVFAQVCHTKLLCYLAICPCVVCVCTCLHVHMHCRVMLCHVIWGASKAALQSNFRGTFGELSRTQFCFCSHILQLSRQLCDGYYYSTPAKLSRMQVFLSRKVVYMNPNLNSLHGGFWCCSFHQISFHAMSSVSCHAMQCRTILFHLLSFLAKYTSESTNANPFAWHKYCVVTNAHQA
jgi:hypothetical protein